MKRDITPTAYQALLDEIIESNSIESNVVDLLDVELSQGMACVQELIKHAHQMGIGVIVSQHDFKKDTGKLQILLQQWSRWQATAQMSAK